MLALRRLAGVHRSSIPQGIAAALAAPVFGTYLYGILNLTILALTSSAAPGHEVSFVQGLFTIIGGALLIALFGAMLAYPGMILVGLPSWFILRRYRAEGALTYGLCGFFGGFMMPTPKVRMSLVGEPLVVHNAVAGALVMLVFWWLARDHWADSET